MKLGYPFYIVFGAFAIPAQPAPAAKLHLRLSRRSRMGQRTSLGRTICVKEVERQHGYSIVAELRSGKHLVGWRRGDSRILTVRALLGRTPIFFL